MQEHNGISLWCVFLPKDIAGEDQRGSKNEHANQLEGILHNQRV